MDSQDYIVGDYIFEDKEIYELAKKEYNNIEKLKQKTNFNNKESVLKVYELLLEKKVFKTPIGYDFLSDMRRILRDRFSVDIDTLPYIRITNEEKINQIQKPVSKSKIELLNNQIAKLKRVKSNCFFIIGILSIAIVIMVYLAATNKNVGYINTENKILDKYSSWEEELNEREENIKEREQALKNNQ